MKFQLLALFIFVSFKIHSQSFMGLECDNYNTFISSTTNPAFLTDKKVVVSFHLSGGGLDLQNNFGAWKFPYNIFKTVNGKYPQEYKNSKNGIDWSPDYMLKNANNSINATMVGHYVGPGISLYLKKIKTQATAGFNYHMNLAMTNTSNVIGQFMTSGLSEPGLMNKNYENQKLNLNYGVYKDYYLGFARSIFEDESQSINMGITLKYVMSNSFLNINSSNINFGVFPNAQNNLNQDINFQYTNGNMALAGNRNNFTTTPLYKEIYNFKGLGNGYGFSIGSSYKYKEIDDNLSDYKYKIGIAINDLGSIKYNSPNLVENINIDGGPNNILPNNYNTISNHSNIYSITKKIFISSVKGSNNLFTAKLPTTFNATFDYHLQNYWFVNMSSQFSVIKKDAVGYHNYNFISISPRYESKKVMVAMPISILDNSKRVGVGLSARLFGMYAGSNNLLTFFNGTKVSGFSAFMGMFIPIYPKEKEIKNACYYPEGWHKAKKKKVWQVWKK